MHVAIVGYDVEGKVSHKYFAARGDQITICDQNAELIVPDGTASQLGADYLAHLDRFDVIVRTPGLPLERILGANPGIADKVTSGTNLFFEVVQTKNIIGVTGTKGKGTTSTLITNILTAAGHRTFLGGNIGVPALSFVNDVQPDDWVVLELSSFQLSDLAHSPHIGVCLMVVPEHLNWHKDFADYMHAKSQLFAHQKPSDIAIYFADNEDSHEIASSSPGDKITYYAPPGAYVEEGAIKIDNQEICTTSELQLLGAHNWQNVCAAVTTAWQAGVMDKSAIKSAITSFSGLEHRLEFVREIDSIGYYDDSFGTTPETAIVALQAFDVPKVAILGGSDKGAPFTELARVVTESNVRSVITIGTTGPKIADEIRAAGYVGTLVSGGDTMQDIVAAARQKAQPGDIVLLSTGCASFGLFKDYKDRGAQFKAAVQALDAAQ